MSHRLQITQKIILTQDVCVTDHQGEGEPEG